MPFGGGSDYLAYVRRPHVSMWPSLQSPPEGPYIAFFHLLGFRAFCFRTVAPRRSIWVFFPWNPDSSKRSKETLVIFTGSYLWLQAKHGTPVSKVAKVKLLWNLLATAATLGPSPHSSSCWDPLLVHCGSWNSRVTWVCFLRRMWSDLYYYTSGQG